MKKLEEKLKEFLSRRENQIGYYIQNGFVNCFGDVKITDEDLVDGKLPLEFGSIFGDFSYYNCHSLTSLKGSPQKVYGDFGCSGCTSLTSLEGCPKEVGGNFYCFGCKNLTTLFGCPEKIGGNVDCSNCTKLTSLDFIQLAIGRRIRVSPEMKLDVDVDVDVDF